MSQTPVLRIALGALVAPLIGLTAIASTSAASSTSAAAGTSAASSQTVASTQPAGPRAALVRIRLATTSDWTKVTFNGRLGGIQVRSFTGAAQVRRLPNGVAMSEVAAGGVTIVFDAVLEESHPEPASWVATEKGQLGTTRIVVENRNRSPYTALNVVNAVRSSTDPTNSKSFTVSRSNLFGQGLTLPRVDTGPRVLAFYYPWFNGSVYQDPTLSDRPADRPDVWDDTDVLAMTRQARSAGVGGFVVSWSGASHDGLAFGKVLSSAKDTGGVAAGLLETVAANASRSAQVPADPAVVEQWLRELLARATHPAYLRANGAPVVFVYEMRRLAESGWRSILEHLSNDGLTVRLVGDAGPGWASVTWGDFDYSPWADDQGVRPLGSIARDMGEMAFETRAFAATHPSGGTRLVATTVAPGYDDRPLRGSGGTFVPRDGDATYRALWDAALGADPDWVLITSWNEWWEGTAIEPGDRSGSVALDATPALVARLLEQCAGTVRCGR